MKKAIMGTKVGMTQIFAEDGKVTPVTVISAEANVVVQKKTAETDGYEAVQLGFADKAERKMNKPQKGHFDKAGVAYKAFLKEFRLNDISSLNVGDEIKADIFADSLSNHHTHTNIHCCKVLRFCIHRYTNHSSFSSVSHPDSRGRPSLQICFLFFRLRKTCVFRQPERFKTNFVLNL